MSIYNRQYINGIGWQNDPSTSTPLNATNLNAMDNGIIDVDTEVDRAFGEVDMALANMEDEIERAITVTPNPASTSTRYLKKLLVGGQTYDLSTAYVLNATNIASNVVSAGIANIPNFTSLNGQVVLLQTGSYSGTTSTYWTLRLLRGGSSQSVFNCRMLDASGNNYTAEIGANSLFVLRLTGDGATNTATVLSVNGASGGSGGGGTHTTFFGVLGGEDAETAHDTLTNNLTLDVGDGFELVDGVTVMFRLGAGYSFSGNVPENSDFTLNVNNTGTKYLVDFSGNPVVFTYDVNMDNWFYGKTFLATYYYNDDQNDGYDYWELRVLSTVEAFEERQNSLQILKSIAIDHAIYNLPYAPETIDVYTIGNDYDAETVVSTELAIFIEDWNAYAGNGSTVFFRFGAATTISWSDNELGMNIVYNQTPEWRYFPLYYNGVKISSASDIDLSPDIVYMGVVHRTANYDYIMNLYKISNTGGGSGSNVFLSDYYSETERVVGTWINGKPLYQKTFDIGSTVTIAGVNSYDTAVKPSDYSMENIISIATCINDQTEPNVWEFVGAVPRTADNVRIYNGRNAPITIRYFTLKYTKTTDAAGTGPSAGNIISLPAIYSLQERQVGVWEDGKPLYQCTWEFASETSVSQTSWTDIRDIVTTSWQYIIFADGLNGSGAKFSVDATCDQGYLRLMALRGQSITLKYVTIRYTKTADTAGAQYNPTCTKWVISGEKATLTPA